MVGTSYEPREVPASIHPTKKGLITVPDKPNDDLARGTLNSILKQGGLKQE